MEDVIAVRIVLAGALLATGCKQLLGIDDVSDLSADAATDVIGGTDALDAPDGAFCYGTQTLLRVCLATEPMNTLTIAGSTVIDTDAAGECLHVTTTQNTKVCVIAAQSITISAAGTLHPLGTRPIVLVAAQQISVDGAIDVSGLATVAAAGSNPGTCATTNNGVIAGGGAGGSFGHIGARGGSGNGGIGGIPAPVSPPLIRGGCPGGLGADGTGGVGGSRGGSGGGAVDLIAGTSITIAGTINASGDGGLGGMGATKGGGGGGGSGGLIAIDAPSFALFGTLMANGGGGGGGAGGAGPPSSGGRAMFSSPTQGGLGGSGLAAGGEGGGTLDASPGIDGMNGTGGGGGGGGGVVLITAPNPTLSGTVSPPRS